MIWGSSWSPLSGTGDLIWDLRCSEGRRKGPIGFQRTTMGKEFRLWVLRRILFFVVLPSLFACTDDPRVVITTKGGGKITLRVEVADTPSERQLGLQYRQELKENQGMLFLFPEEGPRSFWMKNTPISLDIIFIDGRQRVVGIIHEAVPFETQSLSIASPSQFVLETRGGLARHGGVAVGDSVRFEGISVNQVRE